MTIVSPQERPKIGIEYELGLYRRDGTIANRADEVLAHLQERTKPGTTAPFCPEGTLCQVEWNSPPGKSLDFLARELLENMAALETTCSRLDVIPIPTSENGAGRGIPNPAKKQRVRVYEAVVGREALDRLFRISGIHLHIDQYAGREADQFNILTALRPAIAFTSTSPLSADTENGLNCHRYDLFTNPERGVFVAVPEEVRYVRSLDDLQRRDQARYDAWKMKAKQSGIGETEFTKAFTVANTGYPDIRYRPDMGKGTFELRINDSCPSDYLIAYAAFVQGFVHRAMAAKSIRLATSPEEPYSLQDEEVVLPHLQTLNNQTDSAIRMGLRDPIVAEYLQTALSFAEQGLPKREQRYLQPLRETIATRENCSDRAMHHVDPTWITTPRKYTELDARRVNLFMRELQSYGTTQLRAQYNKSLQFA